MREAHQLKIQNSKLKNHLVIKVIFKKFTKYYEDNKHNNPPRTVGK